MPIAQCSEQAIREHLKKSLRQHKNIETFDNVDEVDFLGPRGPLVLPLVDPFIPPSVLKIWITYIQAYMLYESSEDSLNQPNDPMGPCRPTPYPPGTM